MSVVNVTSSNRKMGSVALEYRGVMQEKGVREIGDTHGQLRHRGVACACYRQVTVLLSGSSATSLSAPHALEGSCTPGDPQQVCAKCG